MSDTEVELTIVTIVFDAAQPDPLTAVLSKYVVLSRQQPGCRNIDLCASATTPGRFVVIEKWESMDHLKAHGASDHMKAYGAKNKDLVANRAVHVLQNA